MIWTNKINILIHNSIRPVVVSLTLQWLKYSSENGQAANTQRKPREVLLDTTIKKLQVSFFGGKMNFCIVLYIKDCMTQPEKCFLKFTSGLN